MGKGPGRPKKGFNEALLSAVPIPVFFKDAEGRYLGCNRAFEEKMGVTSDEMEGKTVFELWPSDHAATYHEKDLELLREPERQVYESRVKDGHGEVRDVIFAKDVFFDGDGRPAGIVGAYTDISELKKAEVRLRATLDIIQLSPAVAFLWRAAPDWPVEHVTENVERLFGFAADDLISGRVNYRDIVHPDDIERVVAEVASFSAEPDRVSFVHEPYRIVNRDGRLIWVDDSTHIRRDDGGSITHYQGIVVDATARHEAELERAKLERRVRQAQKLESLEVLAGGIAHDFNNLLVAVIGNADLALANVGDSATVRACLTDIERAAQRASDLARQMLAYSGRGRMSLTTVDLSELVRDMASLLEVSVHKNATLELSLETSGLTADTTQIRQLIMNLITNASEAIGPGGGVVRISTFEQFCDRELLDSTLDVARPHEDQLLESGTYAVLEVSDDGTGMDSATLGRVFEPFFSTKFTGRGLGMAVVLGIVRSHRGAIAIETDVVGGTLVRVYLPAGKLTGEQPSSEPGAASKAETCGLALLVDDEDVVREVVQRMLERLGFEVVTAADGDAAVAVFEEHGSRIQVVLLDLMIPRRDSRSVLAAIRARSRDTRVILSSGYRSDLDLNEYSDLGVDGYLPKPFGLEALAAALKK